MNNRYMILELLAFLIFVLVSFGTNGMDEDVCICLKILRMLFSSPDNL